MLQFEKLPSDKQQMVRRACSFLFSPEEAGNNNFLNCLKPSDVKEAFRKKAKMYHPDMHYNADNNMLQRRKERFVKIKDSYNVLTNVMPCEEKTLPVATKNEKKIIAVGGAKGGIGKSVFAANLGVVLSQMGKKTIVADFDLGGANLHLYLGLTRIKKTLNDFINNKNITIEEVMTKSEYGPSIIGGDSSLLGASNIHFSRKIKLIKALRTIDAEYVVLDLGGDTSYNMIDFFNTADVKIVMTTCEPASYLDAYNFIKVSLYRKLTRIFGQESTVQSERNLDLERIINNFVNMDSKKSSGKISDLIQTIKNECLSELPLINKTLKEFKPILLINKSDESLEANDVTKRISDVSKKMLSIDLEIAPPMIFDKKIEESAKRLVPATAEYSNGYMAERIKYFLNRSIG